MAIKATCSVTLSVYRDTESITRYYKLQSSTATAPEKPTTNPPSGWTDTEPSYTSGSTNTLYFCDLTEFSDGTWAYSTVSKSSSYEAAKEAYNKAVTVETRVATAETEIDKNTEQIALRATKTEVTKVKNQIISRGENLVTNGTAMLGDNTNFSDFTYDGIDTYYSGGSFKYSWTGAVSYRLRAIDELIPVNVSNAYKLSYWIKGNNADVSFWDMLMMYDIDKNIIIADHVKWIDGSTTTLTQELKNGDTVVHLTSVAGFDTTTTDSYKRGLIFWNYTNSKGYTYPIETYSRNRWDSLWSNGSAINTTNNTITLSSAWTNGTFPAGTSVSQCTSGATYTYLNDTFKLPVNTWVYNSGMVQGIGENDEANKFREGTAFISIRWMLWYGGTAACEFRLSNVSLTTNAGVAEFEELRTDTVTRVGELEINSNSIAASVSSLETKVDNNKDNAEARISELERKAALSVTEDQVNIQISTQLQNGATKVETSTGFKFDEDGLNISSATSDTNTQIDENGMTVRQTASDDTQTVMLKADKDGVKAKDLHATTYLIIGTNSRFEDYSSDGTTKDRTACFWIGG